jgi:exopolyphosphatase/guanosine-5'-triphosphate,3'-diphosphate pyrophosphatase
MKVAALDLGSNSFLCLIVEGDKSGIKKVLSDEVKVVRLGQDVDKTGHLHPQALARAKECLSEFKNRINLHQVDRILAMATSATRDAQNANELFKIGQDLGIPIEVIRGEDEARITFAGATAGEIKGPGNVAIIDVGGGSTEFIVGNSEKIHFAKSLNIGAVRLTERFIKSQPLPSDEKNALEEFVAEQIDIVIPEISKYIIEEVVAVAGTPTALAAAILGKFDSGKIQGFVLDEPTLQKWCDLFANSSVQERIDKFGLEPGRADVIFAGTVILHRFLVQSKRPSMKVSIKGVRYGVALEALSRG